MKKKHYIHRRSEYIVTQYIELSATYTEAMQIAHQTWVAMNSVRDMMTTKNKSDAVKALADRAIKEAKK